MSYLVLDGRDGSVLAEFERVADAVRAMAGAPSAGAEQLRLVVFDDSGGAVARTESWITVRSLGDRSTASRVPPRRPARVRRQRRRRT